MSLTRVPLTPWYAHLRRVRRRAARRASHGPWLARLRSCSARWSRSPEGDAAWAEALRRLPSLARLDNAGEFVRTVLRRILGRGWVCIFAENPRTRRWLQRMKAAGIAETLDHYGAPWCLVEELRLLIPEDHS